MASAARHGAIFDQKTGKNPGNFFGGLFKLHGRGGTVSDPQARAAPFARPQKPADPPSAPKAPLWPLQPDPGRFLTRRPAKTRGNFSGAFLNYVGGVVSDPQARPAPFARPQKPADPPKAPKAPLWPLQPDPGRFLTKTPAKTRGIFSGAFLDLVSLVMMNAL